MNENDNCNGGYVCRYRLMAGYRKHIKQYRNFYKLLDYLERKEKKILKERELRLHNRGNYKYPNI